MLKNTNLTAPDELPGPDLAAEPASADDFPITSFKVEQKITSLEINNSVDVSGFANGRSNIDRLQSRYQVVCYSDKFETIPGPAGRPIKKRYGYGYGFTVDVLDIESKISFNFSIIAATATLKKAKANYTIQITGVKDAELIAAAPAPSGSFNSEIFDKLVKFIKKTKEYIKKKPLRLYKIQQLAPQNFNPDTKDYRSIYYAVKKIAAGQKLSVTIDDVKRQQFTDINQYVILFVYRYFGLEDAYAEPSSEQKANADKWVAGTYNKLKTREYSATDDTWVAIEPAAKDGKFEILSGTEFENQYKPGAPPANWKTAGKRLDIVYSDISTEFSSSLKLASIIDTTAELNSRTIIADYAMFMDEAPGGQGNQVVQTRWGVSLRFTLKISNIEFGTEVEYMTVGAVSELGYANVEYEITGLGITDLSILQNLPLPEAINENSMDKLTKAFTDLKDSFANLSVDSLTPQPFMIQVAEPKKVDPTINAQSAVFAYEKIKAREELKDTLGAAAVLKLSADVIKETYKEVGITDENEKPGRDHSDKAKTWLGV